MILGDIPHHTESPVIPDIEFIEMFFPLAIAVAAVERT